MKINRAAHIPWAFFFLALSIGAVLLYVAFFYPQRVPGSLRFFGGIPPGHATVGGTPFGLLFGTIAFGIFIFAALLGMRKKLPHLFPGNVQSWLRAHIWLTLLTVPLILLHSGFRLGSPMTTVLMGLYAVVMLSGIYGLILQQKLPGWMKEQLPAEFVYEQIPSIREGLCVAARRARRNYQTERLATVTAGALHSAAPAEVETETTDPARDWSSEKLLADFIDRQLLPYLEARRGDRYRLGQAREASDTFRYLKLRVAAPYRERVEEMEGWCSQRRLLDAQVKMQHWLHGWLLIHVPLSFLLLIAAGWHAFVTLFHY